MAGREIVATLSVRQSGKNPLFLDSCWVRNVSAILPRGQSHRAGTGQDTRRSARGTKPLAKRRLAHALINTEGKVRAGWDGRLAGRGVLGVAILCKTTKRLSQPAPDRSKWVSRSQGRFWCAILFAFPCSGCFPRNSTGQFFSF